MALIIDLETTGLPMTRNSARRCDKYPNPKYNIAYDQSRLLSISLLDLSLNQQITLIRNENELDDSAFSVNKGKYAGKPCISMMSIIEQVNTYFSSDTIAIGHNVLFDLNILANECLRCSAKSESLIELGLYDRDIFVELHDKIIALIENCRYKCTLEMAKMLGIDDRNIGLSDVVNVLNTNSDYCGELKSLQYHESCDDVKACAFVYRIANSILNRIPKSIDDLTDTIYDPTTCGDESAIIDATHVVTIKLNYNVFYHYHESLKSLYSVLNASDRAEFYIKDIKKQRIFSLNGEYYVRNIETGTTETFHCLQLCDSYCSKCDTCGAEMVGEGRCSDCCKDDSVFEKVAIFISMPATDTLYISTSDVKMMVPKTSFRRKRFLEIETKKSGRRHTVPLTKIAYYVDNKIYEYFSLKIGSVKI